MKRHAVSEYWNDECLYNVHFDDVCKENNLTIARESEYHTITDVCQVVDVFWDENDDIVGCASVNPKTLRYNEEEWAKMNPHIDREEYDDIVNYTKSRANTKRWVYKGNIILKYPDGAVYAYYPICDDFQSLQFDSVEDAMKFLDEKGYSME